MGKGRDKKKKAAKKREDPNKPAPNKKQQQQSTKSAKRKARGGDGDDEEVEDIDSLLTAFQEDLKAAYKVTAEAEAPAPSRRANASLSVVPGSSGELILFGGEAFDGQRVAMFNDLYRILPDDAESSVKWMRVTSPNAPGPRSSHQAVIMPSGKLFLFGGPCPVLLYYIMLTRIVYQESLFHQTRQVSSTTKTFGHLISPRMNGRSLK